MSDRAHMPIPVPVRHRRYRLMLALPMTSLVALLIGSVPTVASAQAQPADPQTPAAPATPAGQTAPAGQTTPDATAPTAQPPDAQPAQAPHPRTSLRVIVKSTDTGAPVVAYAAVRLDSETERAQSRVTTTEGVAAFDGIDDGDYILTVSSAHHPTTKPLKITVPPGVRTELTIFMEPEGATVIIGRSEVDMLNAKDYAIAYDRDSRFLHDFPFNAGNHQDLNSQLLSVPGLAYDSGNNYFVRGDGAVATSVTMDGVLLPATLQGRDSALYSGTEIGSYRAIVGNFAPEYTGSGMALNLTTIPIPTYAPQLDVSGLVGSDSTAEGDVTFGSRGYGRRAASGQGTGTRTFAGAPVGYVIALSQRTTDLALDAPQATSQNIANHGESDIAFAKVNFSAKKDTSIDATINYAFGRTDIADRTGLPDEYAATGQGFGYAGAFTSGTDGSQANDGKGDVQVDYNLLSMVKLNHTTPTGGKFVFALGTNESAQNTNSNTPLPVDLVDLPSNYSTEFKPFINTDYQNAFLQLDYTAPAKNFHQYKAGLVYQGFTGNESYQLVPGSQIALDSLYALDPRLAPTGGSTSPGALDSAGFPIYSLPQSASTSDVPVLVLHRTGTYAAGYAQDTWQVRQALVINYGVRIDSYSSNVDSDRFDPTSGLLSDPGSLANISTTSFSPRLNGVIEFPQGSGGPKFLRFLGTAPTVARFGYNRLFAAPGMDQGNFVGDQAQEGSGGTSNGTQAQPETTDQLDLSIERQIGLRQKIRIGVYDKQITNYLETEQLLSGLQSDLTAVFNQGSVVADGTTITWEMTPDKLNSSKKVGIHAFVSFENSVTHPSDLQQFDNDHYSSGAYSNSAYNGPFAPFVDGDQSDTLSFGLSKTAKDNSSFGLSGYIGTGLYDSAIKQYYLPARQDSTRQGYSQLNFKYDSGPRFLKNTTSLQVEVANLLNTQERIDYFGSFDGTRFQQGIRGYIGFLAHL